MAMQNSELLPEMPPPVPSVCPQISPSGRYASRSAWTALLQHLPGVGDYIDLDEALAILRSHHRYPHLIVVQMMRHGLLDIEESSATDDEIVLRRL